MKISGLFAAAVLLASATSAQAESAPRLHDGFHFQAQAGLGYYSASSDFMGQESSFSGMTVPMALLLGGTVSEGFALGGGLIIDYAPSPTFEANGTEVTNADISQFVVGLGLYGDYYLDAVNNGLHFQGFAGWGGLETSSSGNVGGSDPTGLVAALGVGYEVWISDQWSAGGMARFIYAPLSQNDVGVTTIEPALVGTITWH